MTLPVEDASPTLYKKSDSIHFVMFYHSIVSDWNNGNAHFLRGLVRELSRRGHYVTVYEPRDAWSFDNLRRDFPRDPEEMFSRVFPEINYIRYHREHLHLDEVLDTADVVIVHEWNEHALVAEIGKHRSANAHYTLLFHDTHHRSVTDPDAMRSYDLSNYDGVLAFGNVIRNLYIERAWTDKAWTLHEAADIQLFYPRAPVKPRADLLWVGNWGDEERTRELHEYFFDAVRELQLKSCAYGVRYPKAALRVLHDSGIKYCGLLPNYELPDVTSRFKAMIHVPRRPYVEALPGIPTIRPFEALACGIPLVSSYWNDEENLFTAGHDYLMARTPAEMRSHLRAVLSDPELAQKLAANGVATIREKHTCSHRADELIRIIENSDTPAAKKRESIHAN